MSMESMWESNWLHTTIRSNKIRFISIKHFSRQITIKYGYTSNIFGKEVQNWGMEYMISSRCMSVILLTSLTWIVPILFSAEVNPSGVPFSLRSNTINACCAQFHASERCSRPQFAFDNPRCSWPWELDQYLEKILGL